ncbi:MAG: chorismate-binding protein [Cytophagaceae bacterium]|nr:chorismate-binding protein [Cytophagaceae bacterium]
MKGTINADIENARNIILNDPENLEHTTIVDLIRNDLSQIASKFGLSVSDLLMK